MSTCIGACTQHKEIVQVYKFIHNIVDHYVHTYTKLHTCTIN